MIKRPAIWLTSGLAFAFLFAQSQAQEKAQENGWYSAMNAGREAVEKHECTEAERHFRDAVSLASDLKHSEKYTQFSTAMLLVAQACTAQARRDEPQTENLAQRAPDGMDKALHGYDPSSPEEQFHRLGLAAVLFDQVGHIFATHQKTLEAEKFYQRVIKALTGAVEAHAALEQKTESVPGNEGFYRSMLLTVVSPRDKLAAADEKLARLYFGEHKFAEAAEAYEAALKIRERAAHQHNFVMDLSNLASCYAAQARYDKAEPLYQRALELFEKANWMEQPEAINTMQLYALLLRKTGREDKAKAMLEQAAALKKKNSN